MRNLCFLFVTVLIESLFSVIIANDGQTKQTKVEVQRNRSEVIDADARVDLEIERCMDAEETNIVFETLWPLILKENFTKPFFLPLPIDLGRGLQNEVFPRITAALRLLPNEYAESFEWFSANIPPKYSETNGETYQGLPPNYKKSNIFGRHELKSPFPHRDQLYPFYNFRTNVTSWGYQKFPAFPYWVMPFVRQDPTKMKSSDSRNSLFATNLEDRGPSNLLKKQYMAALTCDKMPLYEAKIDDALDDFYNDIVVNRMPILSSWLNRVFKLYLDVHLGKAEHPSFILDFVEDLLNELGARGRTYDEEMLRRNWCRNELVVDYFAERLEVIRNTSDTSTFLYWWDKAGLSSESLIFEAVHNTIAFTQYLNTLFLLVRAKLQGYLGFGSLLDESAFKPPLDFFEKFAQASTESEQVDVVREAYRILLPTNIWVSTWQGNPKANDGKVPADPDFSVIQTAQVPFLVQALNDNFNPRFLSRSRFATDVSVYDTSRYQDFRVDGIVVSCPFAAPQEFTEDDFDVSSVDGETVLPESHRQYIPVFASGSRQSQGTNRRDRINGPKYCPFGLGYRRCPGEIFNMFVLMKILEKLKELNFTMDPPSDLFQEPELSVGAVSVGISRALDNLFVHQP